VGKIPAESLDAFLAAAAAIQRPKEAELLEYFEHAIALRDAATFLRKNCPHRPLDIVRTVIYLYLYLHMRCIKYIELLEYFEHAIALRDAATFLRKNCPHRPLDIVRTVI